MENKSALSFWECGILKNIACSHQVMPHIPDAEVILPAHPGASKLNVDMDIDYMR